MTPSLPKVNPAGVAHLQQVDPVLADVIARVGPCVVKRPPRVDVFAALLKSIIYQQLHGKAAAAIHTRVLAVLPQVTPEAVLATSEERLRAAGLSAAKWRAVFDLAEKARDGVVPTATMARKLDDETLIKQLTAVRGIGEWTVHMLLIFHLGRPDVLPTGDFAIRKAFSLLFHGAQSIPPGMLLSHAERWRPYRSLASWYLWRSLDTRTGASAPK